MNSVSEKLALPASVLATPELVTFLTRLNSVAYTMPFISVAMFHMLVNDARVPTPSVLPEQVLPASVLTLQTHGGSELSPSMLHSAGVMHGVACAGLPPGQKWPTGQRTGTGEVVPARQPKPGGALQAPLHVAAVCPPVAPK